MTGPSLQQIGGALSRKVMSFEGFLSLTEAIHIDGDEPEIERDLDL